MNKKQTIAFFVLVLVVFLLLFVPYTNNTELFTPKDIPGTENSINPDALKQISKEQSGVALSMMQDLIDISGTIIINIRYENIDDAREDLEEYKSSLGKFDNMVINLDMTESEIDEFQKNNREQLENLEDLTGQIESLYEPEKLQIQYRDSDEQDKYYSVTYDIEKLQEKIEDKKDDLQKSTAKKIESSKKYELQTETLEESGKEIEYIGVKEVTDITPPLTPPLTPSTTPPIETINSKEPGRPWDYLHSIVRNVRNIFGMKTDTTDNVTGEKNDSLFILALIVLVFCLLAIAGYRYYSKKYRSNKYTRADSRLHIAIKEDNKWDQYKITSIRNEYSGMVSEGKENEAFRFLAKKLFSLVSVREHVQYIPSMTNNELLSKLSSTENIRPFTILYEKIVYSGKATTDDKNKLYEIFNDLIDQYLGVET